MASTGIQSVAGGMTPVKAGGHVGGAKKAMGGGKGKKAAKPMKMGRGC